MRFMALGLLAFSVMAASAQERTWGFDKDTVYEWSSGGDTTHITNFGSTALKFDSIVAENFDGKEWWNLSFVLLSTGSRETRYIFIEGVTEHNALSPEEVEPGQSISFMNFDIATFGPTAKASQTNFEVGDTTRARVRIISSSLEEDTLVIHGIFNYASSIRHKSRLGIHPMNPGAPSYDALGRRQQADVTFRTLPSMPYIPR